MFRAHVLIIRRSKLHYTASAIITPIGVMIPEAVSGNTNTQTANTFKQNPILDEKMAYEGKLNEISPS